MTIGELVNNPAFNFNAPFRVLWVGDILQDIEGRVDFDCTADGDLPFDLACEEIVAINDNDLGGVDIEYA